MSKPPPKDNDEDLKIFLDAIENISDSAIRHAKKDQQDKKPQAAGRQRAELSFEIDLHGLTLPQAQSLLEQRFSEFKRNLATQKIKVRVITGKGRHSGPTGPTLSSTIHGFLINLMGDHIVSISESPAQLKINNLPIRGHIDLVIKV